MQKPGGIKVLKPAGNDQEAKCPTCHGTKQVAGKPCLVCRGTGIKQVGTYQTK